MILSLTSSVNGSKLGDLKLIQSGVSQSLV